MKDAKQTKMRRGAKNGRTARAESIVISGIVWGRFGDKRKRVATLVGMLEPEVQPRTAERGYRCGLQPQIQAIHNHIFPQQCEAAHTL